MMDLHKYHFSGTTLLLMFFLGIFPPSSWAGHSWDGYHWPRTSNPLDTEVGDNVTTAWDIYLQEAVPGTTPNAWNDWNDSSVLKEIKVVPGNASNTKRCPPTLGRVEVCNDRYGRTGWLGLAQIWISGDHITQGIAKLNDTYFNTTKYTKEEWRRMVMCQEIGHTFGLDHQDEVFGNTNLGTCMDYTDDPAREPRNERPNLHDYEQLESIYNSHSDSPATLAGSSAQSAASRQAGGDSPAEWGALIRSTNAGFTQIYERELGGGQKIVTFVIWTEERVRPQRN